MNNWVKRMLIGFWGLYIALGQASSSLADGAQDKQVTLVLLPGLTWESIQPDRSPNLHQLIKQGAAANLTLPFGGDDPSGYMAIGAGGRAVFHKEDWKAYHTGEQVLDEEEGSPVSAGQLYQRNTGESPTGHIVVPEIQTLRNMSRSSQHTIVPGALGTAVLSAGGRVAVIGNSDLGDEVYRPAVFAAMDNTGQTFGDVSRRLLRKDSAYLYGVGTDWDKLYQTYKQLRERTNFLVIETGDLTRLASKRHDLNPARKEQLYQQLLAEADRFLGQLSADVGPNRLLLVASPISFAENPSLNKAISVLLANGGGIPPGSVLTSNTTRQVGLVTVYDLALTVLSFLGLHESFAGGIGEPMQVVSAPGIDDSPAGFLEQQFRTLVSINQYRPIAVKGFVELMTILLFVTFVAQTIGGGGIPLLQHLLVGMLTLPAVFLLQSALGTDADGILFWGKMAAILLFTGSALAFLPSLRSRLLMLAAATGSLLTIDMLRQGAWMKESVLGYDLLGGARYYGIGNEYMGILIGSVLFVYVWARIAYPDRAKQIKQFAGIGFAMTILLLAAPQFGTNAGGALAAAFAFLYVLLTDSSRLTVKNKWKWIIGGFLAILLGMVTFHAWVPLGEQTHIGKAAVLLGQGDFAEIGKIISRKWLLNWRLLNVSAWGKMFWMVMLVVITDMIRLLINNRRHGTDSDRLLYSRFYFMAGIALFLLNDSGVLAAAGCMMFGAAGILTGSLNSERIQTNRFTQDDLAEDRTT